MSMAELRFKTRNKIEPAEVILSNWSILYRLGGGGGRKSVDIRCLRLKYLCYKKKKVLFMIPPALEKNVFREVERFASVRKPLKDYCWRLYLHRVR